MARQPEEVTELRRALGAALASYLDASSLNQSDLARKTNYDRSSVSHITHGRQFPDRDFWVTADDALGANGTLVAQYDNVCDQEDILKRAELDREQVERHARIREMTNDAKWVSREMMFDAKDAQGKYAHDEGRLVNRRGFLAAGGVAAFDTTLSTLSSSTRVLQALEIVTSDQADTLGIATDCLNELVSHYSEKLSVAPPTEMYDDLLNIRLYAGTLFERSKSPTRRRSDLIVTTGWLSNLLAIATSYMGDHESALIWCVDAERCSCESRNRDIASWAALTRAMIATIKAELV